MSCKPTDNTKPTDEAVVSAFQKRMRTINETRIVHGGGLNISTTLRWKAGGDLIVESAEPDADDWRSLFALIRPFIAEGDSATIRKVLSVIQRTVTDEELLEAARNCGIALNQALNSGVLRLDINGRQYTPIEIIQHRYNSDFVHDDLGRVERDGPALEAATTAPFVSTVLHDTAITIVNIARHVDAILDEARERGVQPEGERPTAPRDNPA